MKKWLINKLILQEYQNNESNILTNKLKLNIINKVHENIFILLNIFFCKNNKY